MPISGDKKDKLSLYLYVTIETAFRDFCAEKQISNDEVSEIVDYRFLNRLARNFGLRVKVEELAEEPITATKETPLEIIDRIVVGVANNEKANSPPLCERDILY
ncbi:MAG: hypothetical protein HW401_736 [Parcubacteria group bacterium]|nr:hypothetical protein [Parcubacteria group bacterium]